MKKLLTTTICFLVIIISLTAGVSAQSAIGEVGDVNLDIDEKVGLQRIEIPFFDQIALPGDEYSTTISWLSFAGSIISIGIIVFWIYLILRASFEMLKGEGDPEATAESFKKLKSVFLGAGISILFPVLLSIIGWIMGLGPLWSWPAAFRDCPGTSSNYYYQEVLEQDSRGVQNAVSAADEACF